MHPETDRAISRSLEGDIFTLDMKPATARRLLTTFVAEGACCISGFLQAKSNKIRGLIIEAQFLEVQDIQE